MPTPDEILALRLKAADDLWEAVYHDIRATSPFKIRVSLALEEAMNNYAQFHPKWHEIRHGEGV